MNTAGQVDDALMREIVVSDLLQTRAARAPDYRLESEALAGLADVFATAPDALANALVLAAMQLTGAHAAGISLREDGAAPGIFRWIATAGTYERYLNGTMPLDFSPCGEVICRDEPMLMRQAVKFYPYISTLHAPAHEVLLVPFHRGREPIGTVWIVSHDDSRMFDKEDLRIVKTLTRFAAAAVDTVGLVRRLSDENSRQQETDARKDRFLAMLAHEMRSPLSAISLCAQLIKRAGDDAARRRSAVASIERQAVQLTALVSDITDVVAIRSGKMSLNLQPVTVQEVVARALDVCGEPLEAKHQRLDVDMPESPLMVRGDVVRLTQVVVNLIGNAIKYTPEHGLVAVSARADGDAVAFEVSDSGIGIPADTIEHVFDMFMQAPMLDRPVNSGLGIGLALVKQFVELHGGAVGVRSAGQGRGSTFSVRLPRLTQVWRAPAPDEGVRAVDKVA